MGAESEGYLLALEFRSFSKNKEDITFKKEFSLSWLVAPPPTKTFHICKSWVIAVGSEGRIQLLTNSTARS